jgi:glyoxalase family protein
MTPKILSLHHVTATVGDAQVDLDFYAGHLGLRLVKQTVNFDNHHVFHFYYGNERGSPGTIMTTFPYKGMGVPVGRKGAGQITVTSFSVPQGSLGAWRQRLSAHGVTVTAGGTRFGEEFIAFRDPSGLDLELVATDHDARLPWVTPDISPAMAIRGVHSVTLAIRAPESSIGFLTGVLGWSISDRNEHRTRLGVIGGGPGQRLDILHAPDAPPAMNGLGTVHHVAMAIGSSEEQLAVRAELVERGYDVTEVRDRQYFLSIYFREPGGVLYEIATVGPGFAVDEAVPRLGRALKLPPWEEPHRAMIEAGLPAVSFPEP